MSTGYRFYLLRDDHIVGVQSCDCTNDSDAMLEAGAFLQASVQSTVEVWQERRCVGVLTKPTQSVACRT
jgi:hypothetical protein